MFSYCTEKRANARHALEILSLAAQLPPVFTASFLHPDPPLSPQGSDLLKSFLKSIFVPSAIVLLYDMVLTTTSKPLFDYLIIVLLLAILYDHIIIYV